ncbi:hypothetical protein BDZ45DRAFT_753385 [Acephala macrosclerotiorum]|nr:hypothetical protein BDZ45DRAFT_753385 [Acephala macrosclerotiorum]
MVTADHKRGVAEILIALAADHTSEEALDARQEIFEAIGNHKIQAKILERQRQIGDGTRFTHSQPTLPNLSSGKYIACCVIIWGIVLACMSACHNFAGLMTPRTALGILEVSINCGFSMINAACYRKYEHETRVGIWSSMTGVATIVSGVIAYGCVVGEEKHPTVGVSSWKILSLITGLISVVYGAAMLHFMAGSVVSAKLFSEEEKTLAIGRLRDNHQGVGSTQYKRYCTS